MARKRLERVQVPDDVRQRFIVNLDRMQELALGPKGLLATMRNGQQLAASLQSLNQQARHQSGQQPGAAGRDGQIGGQHCQREPGRGG